MKELPVKVIKLNQQELNEFLASRRLAVLSTNSVSGYPVSVPLWYSWDSKTMRMFSLGNAAKIARLRRDPRVNVLVSNVLGESVRWIALEGKVTIDEGNGFRTAIALLARHVDDLGSPVGREARNLFQSVKPHLVELKLVPNRIRTYAEIQDQQ